MIIFNGKETKLNIKQVKEKFTLRTLLSSLGYQPDPKKSKGNDLWYKSPFRPNEKTPSFHIDTQNDIYKDFGDTEKGGDLIWFAQIYLKNRGQGSSVSDALKWFDDLAGGTQIHSFNGKASKTNSSTSKAEIPFKIISDKEIFSNSLIQYLQQKCIPFPLAKKYFRQIYFLNRKSGKNIFGLGFKTRAGGYDIRTPNGFKTMIGNKDITVIKGARTSQALDVFEGASDFLSMLTIQELDTPPNDCLILNSANLYAQGAQFIENNNYSSIILWLDNDNAGDKFKAALIDALVNLKSKVSVFQMNHIYEGFEDVNAWHKQSALNLINKKNALSQPPKLISSISNKDDFRNSRNA